MLNPMPVRGRSTEAPLLQAIGITKLFGTFKANDSIDLVLFPREIHALLGENGAGKSTLVKIIYGALQPSSGELRWKGNTVAIPNPAAARLLGIGMVFQHFSLFDALTVTENIALALPKEMRKGLAATIERVSADYGLPLRPNALVADLSVGERQRIEIVRCLLQSPQLLIMDEPTSVLTPHEADHLFVTLQRLAREGCAVLYISHRLEEVQRICHHATIMRRGKVVAETDPAKETAATLARLMVDTEVLEVARPPAALGPVRLSIASLELPTSDPFGVSLKSISLDVRGGEVVAIAGIAGNGQGELFSALSGEQTVERPDAVVIDGHEAGRIGITERRNLGAAFVPEERLGHGAVPGLKLSDNVVLTRHRTGDELVVTGIVRPHKALKIVDLVTAQYDVRKDTANPEARSLSGGNLQKFVVGREVDRRPGVLIVSQPTWGVDAGAAALIRQALIDLARAGSAVLVISQDLDEIFEIADRIAVISRGHLSPAEAAATATRESIGLLMGGVGEGAAAKPGQPEEAAHAAQA
ncbi:MAG: ABC transporter ATP-binding protein [Pseudolabrys sp.]